MNRIKITALCVSLFWMLCICEANNDISNLVISSSPKGEFLVNINISNSKCYLLDIRKEKIYETPLPDEVSKYFIIWNSDTTFLYALRNQDKVKYYEYSAIRKNSKLKLELADDTIKSMDNSKFIKAPNFIASDESPFVLFVRENRLNVFYPFENKVKYLYDLAKVISDNKLISIAVDSKCENVAMTVISPKEKLGRIIKFNLGNGKNSVIEKSSYIIDDSYVYFLNNDSTIIYFRYKGTKEIEIVSNNFISKREKILSTYNKIAPSYLVDLPKSHRILINVLDLNEDIVVEKSDALNKILRELLSRFMIMSISY